TTPVVSTTLTPAFDALGNLTGLTDSGDVGVQDDVAYVIKYDPSLAGRTPAIFKPSEIRATGASGLLRKRTAGYDARGALTTLTNVVTGGKDPSGAPYSGAASTWTFTPDAFGNVTQEVDPGGYTLTYVYDTTVETYRTSTSDSFNYVSLAS